MRPVAATLAAAALAAMAVATHPAAAQMGRGGGKADTAVEKEYQRLQKEREELDKQYRETVKRNLQGPGQVSNDPWANIRSATPAKGAR